MDTYRDEHAALLEQVDALKRELEETQRSLDEARKLAEVHKKTAHAFETELMRAKPRPLAAISQQRGRLVALVFGVVFGVLLDSGFNRKHEREETARWEQRLHDCQERIRDCRR